MSDIEPATGQGNPIAQLINLRPGEAGRLLLSFLYFFFLLGGYYVLRPVRETMGVEADPEQLQWLFTATFVVMLLIIPIFGKLVSRFPRAIFVPAAYYFFAGNILIFFILFKMLGHDVWLARVFYVWISVYNLFVVSVFWSFMVDIWDTRQARRLFGVIAAGGSAGALTGPTITATLVEVVGTINLLPIAAGGLIAATVCVHLLARATWTSPKHSKPIEDKNTRIGGSVWAGAKLAFSDRYLLGIVGIIFLAGIMGTFLYFQQAFIVEETFATRDDRTQVFAGLDLATNSLTIVVQFFIVSRLVKSIGVGLTLASIPLFVGIGFICLAVSPVFAVLAVVMVISRVGKYAIMRPAREMLFSKVPLESKYKAKNFIDTAVFRGGDAASGWVYRGFSLLGLGAGALAAIAVPIAGAMVWLSLGMGRAYNRRRDAEESQSGG